MISPTSTSRIPNYGTMREGQNTSFPIGSASLGEQGEGENVDFEDYVPSPRGAHDLISSMRSPILGHGYRSLITSPSFLFTSSSQLRNFARFFRFLSRVVHRHSVDLAGIKFGNTYHFDSARWGLGLDHLGCVLCIAPSVIRSRHLLWETYLSIYHNSIYFLICHFARVDQMVLYRPSWNLPPKYSRRPSGLGS